jgi:hypothetical protein
VGAVRGGQILRDHVPRALANMADSFAAAGAAFIRAAEHSPELQKLLEDAKAGKFTEGDEYVEPVEGPEKWQCFGGGGPKPD